MSEYEAGFRNALGKVEGAGTPESLGTAVTGLLKIHADNSVPIGPTAAAVVVQRAASLKVCQASPACILVRAESHAGEVTAGIGRTRFRVSWPPRASLCRAIAS